MTKQDLTVIILTYNEELHIRRAIESVKDIASVIWIVDSYSKDHTLQIAHDMGVNVIQNTFINQASQFLWALEQCKITTGWIMRLDADEYVTSSLNRELENKLSTLSKEVTGIILKRQMHFMGKWIRHGGYYPVKLLRIWRSGAAMIEQRWMDEQIYLLHGKSILFDHDIIDENLNSLTWWTIKHNEYATREAVDIFRIKYNKNNRNSPLPDADKTASGKRWYKDNMYNHMPLFLRSFLYFLYRYILKLGFLDGTKGLIWHFLQGFWYRFLVDAKIYQIKYFAFSEHKSIQQIIEEKHKINIVKS